MNVPKWAVVVLGLVFNVIGTLGTMHVFAEGSTAAKAFAIVGMVVGNVLTFLGVPLVGPKPLVIPPGVLTAVPKDGN